MIGVIAPEADERLIEEFFQLFKTPWEPYAADRGYDVTLCTADVVDLPKAKLTVVYGTGERSLDRSGGIRVFSRRVEDQGQAMLLNWRGTLLPVYGGYSRLTGNAESILTEAGSAEAVGIRCERGGRILVRMGYDPFRETGILLLQGQPAEHAGIPALEIHIDILRELMKDAGVVFAEIPSIPFGYELVSCLTHDVDFYGIRKHFCDRTMFGFLYRATWGTVRDCLRGRVPRKKLWRNLRAVLALPAVYIGLVRDFWARLDQYLALEEVGTYFLLPATGVDGVDVRGNTAVGRAGPYDADLLREEALRLLESGCEVGLHGIEAWRDARHGFSERGRISELCGRPVGGVRMHWLFFDEQSGCRLEQAGLAYDSTCGYNDGVGFRAGTAQVFRLPPTNSLMELPLLIQDTALFSGKRMGLSYQRAAELCRGIINRVLRYGGVVTLNWHARSVLPERLWGDFYSRLLENLRKRTTWFATAEQVTRWYSARRAVLFSEIESTDCGAEITVSGIDGIQGPPFALLLHGHGRRDPLKACLDSSGRLSLSWGENKKDPAIELI